MDPIWYTIRTVVTVVMAGIGGLLLWAAYLVAGNVTGAAIAWMVLLAVAITETVPPEKLHGCHRKAGSIAAALG